VHYSNTPSLRPAGFEDEDEDEDEDEHERRTPNAKRLVSYVGQDRRSEDDPG
jgi:hypothetical protein